MKNTPKVNEVLNDDALLKRYRKEILDLKKQLEEVCNKHTKISLSLVLIAILKHSILKLNQCYTWSDG